MIVLGSLGGLQAREKARILWLLSVSVLLALASPAICEPFDVHAYVWTRLTVANNASTPYPIPPLIIDLPSNGTYQLSLLSNVTVRVSGSSVQCPVKVGYGDCGSPYLSVVCKGYLPPRKTLEVEVVSEVWYRRFRAPPLDLNASGSLEEIPPYLSSLTRSEGPWRYRDEQMSYLAEAARRVVDGERRVLSIVAKLVDWVWSKVEYEVGPGPRYPHEALPRWALEGGRGKGDCDDQANLLILALRSLGIPSYLETALVADFNYGEERTIWEPWARYYVAFLGINYGHAWAEVFVPPWGWLPVDLTFHAGSGNPLDAIETGAASDYWVRQQLVTVRIGSVCHEDYIADFRRQLAEAAAQPLFYYWEYAVVREGDSIVRVKSFLKGLPLPWVKPVRMDVNYPSRARALTTLTLAGRLNPPVVNATVILTVKRPSGRTTSFELLTDSEGRWQTRVFLDEAGAWGFAATYPGSADYSSCSREFTVYVEKLESRLEVHAKQKGGSIEVNGTLQPALNATITLIVETPEGRRESFEVEAVQGNFSRLIPAGEPGFYTIQAFWAGDSVHDSAYAKSEAIVRAPTRIEATAEVEGGRVTLRGALRPALANATIALEATGGAFRVTGAARTNASGAFTASLELGEGEWTIVVRFNGSPLYEPCSTTLEITLASTTRSTTLAAAAAAAAALVGGWYLKSRRRRRRPQTQA